MRGTETNAGNGKRCTFDGTISATAASPTAAVEDVTGEFRGEICGSFDRPRGGGAPERQVEERLRAAIRDSIGYRP